VNLLQKSTICCLREVLQKPTVSLSLLV